MPPKLQQRQPPQNQIYTTLNFICITDNNKPILERNQANQLSDASWDWEEHWYGVGAA